MKKTYPSGRRHPGNTYTRMLEGKITPERYVAIVMRYVNSPFYRKG